MILDNGEQVFLWVGRKTSDVEIKLAFKSVQVFTHVLLNSKKKFFNSSLKTLGSDIADETDTILFVF